MPASAPANGRPPGTESRGRFRKTLLMVGMGPVMVGAGDPTDARNDLTHS